MLFIDLKTAFDTIPRENCLQLLSDRNILTEQEISLVKFLWTNLSIKYSKGSKRTFQGVPQGSIISPLLFSIFTITLIEKIHANPFTRGSLYMYADDIAFGCSSLYGIREGAKIIK